jgi:hypothetical protein
VTARQDLLEAQAFQRRRLLAVLVGGAPSEHDAVGPRSARALVGGTMVAVLVVVGAVVLQLLR